MLTCFIDAYIWALGTDELIKAFILHLFSQCITETKVDKNSLIYFWMSGHIITLIVAEKDIGFSWNHQVQFV